MSRATFKPFSKGKKNYNKRDDKAPASMRKLTTGAWEKGKTLTDKQKKRVHI